MARFTQDTRNVHLSTPLGADRLLLDRFVGEEGVSTPFLFTLDLISEDEAIDATALVRKPVCVTIDLPTEGDTRMIHGRVRRFRQLDRRRGVATYQAEVVPWLWFLSLSSDCRIYQEKTVPEILGELFQELGYSDFQLRLSGSYDKREYCVQYRETHLEFVHRLLEEEGIFYFFEHTDEKHTLVLADATSAVRPVPGQAKAALRPQVHATGAIPDDVVSSVRIEQFARTGSVAVTDYNFTTPSASLGATSQGAEQGEHFVYPGNYGVREQGDRAARLRLEALEVDAQVVHLRTTVRAFLPGYRFTLEDHFRREANKQYQILRVQHRMTGISFLNDDEETFSYENDVVAVPYAVPYRPPRVTPRPIVHGTQTAVVVGPKGEEIYVDKYGRVKVQFHWDRKGTKDEKSSCWVRVASTWAGKNWGFIQIPRIGQEVIVDYLDGNPDQPIIIGSVYNAEQMPPYGLPANQTQSGLKSRSSKGGGAEDFNELRFEDKKGSEEIYLHAQKDWNTKVENDRTLEIGHDETITVDNNRTKTVKKDEKTTVNGKREEKVDMTEKVEVGQSREVKIGTSDKLEAGTTITIEAGQSIALKANQEISLTVGGTSIKLTQTGVEITGTSSVKVMAASSVDVQGGTQVGIQGGGQVSVQGGKVGIMGGLVTIN